jgi:hypothetical protein
MDDICITMCFCSRPKLDGYRALKMNIDPANHHDISFHDMFHDMFVY